MHGVPRFSHIHAGNYPRASCTKGHSIQKPNTYPQLYGRVNTFILLDPVHTVSSLPGRYTLRSPARDLLIATSDVACSVVGRHNFEKYHENDMPDYCVF